MSNRIGEFGIASTHTQSPTYEQASQRPRQRKHCRQPDAAEGRVDGSAIGFLCRRTKLLDRPAEGRSAEELAALERDEQLIAAGRDAVGMTVGIPRRQEQREQEPKDELDDLVDELNDLDI